MRFNTSRSVVGLRRNIVPKAGWLLSAALLVSLPALRSGAQSLYWDANGVASGAGAAPAGVWGSDLFWSIDPNGEAATGAWTDGLNAVFAAGADATGAYTVGLNGPQTAGSLIFEEGNVTLSGATPGTNLTWNGAITVASGATANLSTMLSGASGLTKDGAGVLVLGNTNNFTGNVVVNQGVLSWSVDTSAGGSQFGAGPAAVVPNAITINDATLRFTGGVITMHTNRGITLGGSGGTIDVTQPQGTGILLFDGTTQSRITGGTLTKTGIGEVRIYSATNTFSKLVINQGAVAVGQSTFPGFDECYGAVPASVLADAVTIANGATNRTLGSTTVTTHANRGFTLGAGGGVLRNDVVAMVVNGPITGPGGLTKFAARNLTLNGTLDYTGPTIIDCFSTTVAVAINGTNNATGPLSMNSGILTLNTPGSYSGTTFRAARINVNTNACLGTGPITISPTQNVIFANASAATPSFVSLPNDITVNNTGFVIDIAANSGRELILNGKVSGDANLLKNNSGSTGAIGFSNPANDFTGILTNNTGTVIASANNALGAISGGTIISNGASIAFRGGINYSTPEPLLVGGVGRLGFGAISNDSGNNTFAGPVTVYGNTVVGGLPGSSLRLDGTIGETGGSWVLTKFTPCTVILGAANTYSGGTIISNGTLVAANTTGSATGPGPVTIYPPGALAGPGSIAGTLTVNGALSPGASPGTLNTSSEIWNGGGSYVWEINDVDAGQGMDPGWDLINVAGTLTINATPANKFTIDITSLTPANAAGNVSDFDASTDYVWTILKTTGGITGFAAAALNVLHSNFSNPIGAGLFLVETANGGNDLVVRFVRAPAIAVQPANAAAECATGSATFTVTATGTAPLTYQWRRNGVDIGGANAASLIINPTISATAGNYDVVVANAYGTVTSTPASLTVADTIAPIITTCAPNQTLSANSSCHVAIPDLTGSVVASDTCSAVTISQSPTAGTLVGLGAHTVTITVLDAANNPATCTATVTVNDTTAPTITACAPSQSITATLAGCQAALPDLTAQVTATDNCAGAVVITQSPVAGTLVGVGPTTVTLTATDVAGNPATCQTTVTVNSSVTVSVNSATTCPGGSATLTATTAAASPTYLWSPGGATTASITVSPGATTTYTVTVTDGVSGCTGNGSGTVTIGSALVVTVNSATICPGDSATLTATTSASNPTYLWSPGGATTASIIVSPGSTASYSVTVTDDGGCTGTGSGTVTVRAPQTFANAGAINIPDFSAASPYPSSINVSGLTATVCKVTVTLNNLSHAFPDDVDMVLIAPNGQGVLLLSDVGGANPVTGITLTLDDSAANSLPDSAALTSGTFKPTNIGAKSDSRPDNFPAPVPAVNFVTNLSAFAGINPNGAWSLYMFDDEPVDVGSLGGGWSLNITTLTPFADVSVAQTPVPNPVGVGSNLTFNITVSNPGPAGADIVSLTDTLPAGMTFVSATPSQGSCGESLGVVTCAFGSIAAGNSVTVTIAVTPTAAGAGNNAINVTSATLDLNTANNTSAVSVTVLDPPLIVTGPASQVVCADHSASFSVIASGAAPLSYQWYLNDVAIGGATAASYSVVSAQAGDAGTYKVIVSNAVGASQAVATLTVNPLPGVAVNSATICVGGSATLTAATGAASPSYLWSPGGQTTASITVSPASTTIYTVLVTDGVTGCTNSASGTVTVKALTTATTLTSINNLCPGSPASFSTTAGGDGPFTYVWRKNGSPLGETSGTLSIASVTASDAGAYSVEVTGFCNTVTNSATLSVVAPPAITAQPQSQSAPMGNNASFSVTATGVGPISYQWRLNGADISGATGTSLTVSNLTLSQSGQSYSVAVSNCAGTTLSAAAVLTVTPITGISFDFNTPGQFTNAPFNLKSNSWMSSAIVNGLNNPMIPTVPFEVPALSPELATGGTAAAMGGVGATPSGALDLAFNNGTDHGNTLLPVNYDFSLHGKTLVASIMMKIKIPTAVQRATQIGFVTTTNINNAWQQINANNGQGFISVIMQSTVANSPQYMLRAQFKPVAGTTATETQPINVPTNVLATNNWYKLVAKFVNIKDTTANTYTVESSLQDMGANGQTPGAVVLAYPPQNQANADLVNARNLLFCIRGFENGGIDFWDNVYITTTNGPVYFVQSPQSQTVQQGRQVAFRALVDGDGPYTYQWKKNGTPILGAGSWNYTTPPLLLSDDQAQYTVTVTSPNNTVTSVPAVVTVQPDALNVVSVGSVDGSSIGVRFDQPVNKASAEVGANYLVNGVAAWSASVRDSGTDVLVIPSTPVSGPFTVVVQNVQSLSGTLIGAGNSASGTAAGLTGYDLNPLSVGANGQVSTVPGESVSFGPGAFDIKGGGHDIFGNFDGYRFVYQLRTGDFDVKVRVPYLDLLRTPNKAGFAVRPTLDPYGPNIFAGVNPMLPGRNIYEGTMRQTYNVATTSWGNGTACAYPNTWLRFRRAGNTFMRYSSTNGVDWLFDGQTSPTPAFPDTVYFGFAVCANVGAGNLQQMIRAEFDNYGGFGGYPGAVISSVTLSPLISTVLAGNATNLTATVTTGGLPAGAGELTYLWQRDNGVGGWTNLLTAGATNNTVSTGALLGSDNGAQYRVVVSAPGALSVTSAVAVVTVTDTTAPTVASSVFYTNSLNQLIVTFNENVSAATALNPANYTVTNGAGAVFPVATVAFLGGDPRVVLITTVNTLPADTYGVRITGVQDLGGNAIAATTRTFSQQAVPALAPIVVDIYTGLHNSGTDILTLTTNLMFVNDTPSFIVYSNVFGINPLNANFPDTINNYGVRMYTYFVPPTSGAYKFYVRADDFAELWMNTNAVNSTNRAGATLQLALTGNQQAYTAANSRTNTLVGGQRYYLELRFKESTGGDGGTVAVRTDNTVPGQGEVIGRELCAFPDAIAPRTPFAIELYTGQVTVNSQTPNDLGAAFGSGGLPDLIASTNTINFIARLPNVTGYEKSFAFKQDLREAQATFDNYMGRMFAYFIPPSNGVYRFYFRHDDTGELWMNTNATDSANPAGISLLGAANDFYDASYRFAGQTPVLTASQPYYIEGRWREGGGGDGLTVAVRAGNDFTLPPATEAAPGSLFAFPTNYSRIGPVGLVGIGPQNPTVSEGQSITFIASGISGTAPYGFVWLKNGQQVQASQAFYVTPPLTSADNGAVFSLMVSNQFGTVTRSSTVSVVTDTTAPSIVSAVASTYGDSILVTFSEPVEPFTAQSLANYRINGLAILGADWDEIACNRVSLRTAPMAANTTYTLVVNGVRDLSTAGNAVVNGTAVVSTLVAGGQGAVLVEVFTNVPNTSVDWLFTDPRYLNSMADISYYTNQFSYGFFGADTGFNNYGVRVSGVFMAPSNGLYRFFVRGDDGTRLYMNTNGSSPAGRTLIARSDGANSASNLVVTPQLTAWQTGVGLGTLGASVSPIISLTNGGAYYLEALMKEGGGGDHLEVLMRAIDPGTLTEIGGLPFNATVNDPVPGSFFGAPGNPDQNRLVILQSPPANLSVSANDSVALQVSATTVPISILYTLGFQWQKFDTANSVFVNIPGQTQPSYVFDATPADNGAKYRVIVSIPGTNVAYTTTLSVTADNNPPRLIAASSLDGMSIGVCYSERVTALTAGDNFNYTVNGGANAVLVAQARPDGRSAILYLDSPVSGTFTVQADNIEDVAAIVGGGVTNGIVQGFSPLDVGGPTILGSSFSCMPGEIDVTAGGADIWSTADQGHLTLTPRYGDFDIHTRVQSITRVDAIAKAGLMVREKTNSDSRTLHNLVNPPVTLGGRDQGEAGLRPNPGVATALIPGSLSYYPVGIPDAWVRIKRTGSLYIAYRGWDGVNWIEIGRANLGFPDPVLIGLATTAHNNAAPATLAEYRNVHIPNTPTILVQPSPATQLAPLNGSATYSVVASNPPNSGPLTYQWKKNGVSIPGANSATLNLTGLQAAQSGIYTVWVGNDGGATISSAVELFVDNLPPLVGNDSLSTPQNAVLNTPVSALLVNDSDPDGGAVSILAVSGLPPVTYASDFNSGLPAGSAVFGVSSAEATGGVGGSGYLRINAGVASQAGAFVLNELTPRRRVSAFVASFKLRIAEGSTQPADGFSFNFGPDVTIGTAAAAENGAGTGLSFCVDNYQFAPFPAGGGANTSGLKLRYGGGDVAFLRTTTWDRDAWVPVTVSVDAQGNANVYVDGTNVFGNVVLPWVPRVGRFAFYGRTGGQFESHAIDDLSITTMLTVETAREANFGGDLFGNAYVDNGFLHVNDSAAGVAGSFIPNELTPGVPVTSFNASFKLRIGNGSAEPADGFSFNFAGDLPLSATTLAAAENGGGTGFSFCVDNYRFAPYPAGGTATTSGMKIRYGGVDIAGVQIPTWNNNAFIPVSISLASDGALTVLVDGTNVFGALTLPWTPTIGRFGLYGRTGGQNETHWVDDLALNVTTAGSPGSFTSGFDGGGFGTVVLNGGTVTYTPPGGACGTDTYYYLASDGQAGGVTVGTVNVLITDSVPTPPVITTCPASRALTATVGVQAPLPDLRGEVVATDNCGTVTITQSPAPGTLVGPGQVIVTITVTDTDGLVATCQATVTVIAPTTLTGASYNGVTFSAGFQTAPGLHYTVQYTDNLNTLSWTTLTVITGDGTLKTFTDPGPLPSARFYRVLVGQ